MKTQVVVALAALTAAPGLQFAQAQRVDALGPEARKYLRVNTSRVVLTADQPVVQGTSVLDLRGYSVMPGIVGMHDHLWYLARPDGGPLVYDGPTLLLEMGYTASRLYVANGVTTMRTAGSVNPYFDLKLKQAIENGSLPGPHLDVTGPYLDGAGVPSIGILGLTGPEDARETVRFWAKHGVTSFKAYSRGNPH